MSKTEWTVSTLKEHYDAMLVEREKQYQADLSEIRRRLSDLNHAHERAVEVQHTYVTQEKFDDFRESQQVYKETTATALTLAAGATQGISKTARVVAGSIAAAVGLLTIVVVLANVFTN